MWDGEQRTKVNETGFSQSHRTPISHQRVVMAGKCWWGFVCFISSNSEIFLIVHLALLKLVGFSLVPVCVRECHLERLQLLCWKSWGSPLCIERPLPEGEHQVGGGQFMSTGNAVQCLETGQDLSWPSNMNYHRFWRLSANSALEMLCCFSL